MKISINKFKENIESIDVIQFEHTIHDERDHLHGLIKLNHEGAFPKYIDGDKKWLSHGLLTGYIINSQATKK